MTKAILAILLMTMAAVVVVLARGIGTLGGSGIENARKANRLMRWRIGLQLVAVILVGILVFIAQRS